MSSIGWSLNEWLNNSAKKEQLLNDISQFIQKEELYFFGLLSIYKEVNGQLERDLVLVTNEYISNCFEQQLTKEKLNLIKKGSINDNLIFIIYKVDNVELSRKYWQPIFEKLLSP
jgi:hypothetical protein